MIGSLGQYLSLDDKSMFGGNRFGNRQQKQLSPVRVVKKRGKSTFESYVPSDKTDLLEMYEKNNIFNINRKKYNPIVEDARSKDYLRKPLYEHKSFFVKPQIARDYIAKEELKRKHNLLRAMLRMKQTEDEPKGTTDYQQSFQRLYTGLAKIHPQPTLTRKQTDQRLEREQGAIQKILSYVPTRNTSGIPHKKRLEYQNCLHWAKKHNKNGDFFAEKLGKLSKRQNSESPNANRSLVDEIGKKVVSTWIQ